MAAIPVPGVNTPTYQSWGAAVTNKLNQLGFAGFTKTTSAAGEVTVTAAELGLSAINGVVGNVTYSVSDANAASRISLRLMSAGGGVVASGGVSVSGHVYNRAGTATVNNASVIFFLMAWGTAGSATSRPGLEGPEVEPHDSEQ